MNLHIGPRFQKGRGIGAIFSGLFRALKPIASMGLKAGKKILSSDLAKNIGSKALEIGKNAARNIAVDVLEGKNVKESINEQIDEAKKTIAQDLRGSGKRKRKKKKSRKSFCNKKKKYNLLYSDDE